MPNENRPISSERGQTDESLRAERDRAAQALGEELANLDETADAVIERARARADQLLAAARSKADRSARAAGRPTADVALERERADQLLEAERANADEALRIERAQQLAELAVEREETDKDLSSEREQADSALAQRDEFLGIVSHDLRNMLRSMVLFAGVIAHGAKRDDPQSKTRTYAQRIERMGTRMSRLIGDLIDIASIDAGALAVTRELLHPLDTVTEAVETLQAEASVRQVTLEVAPMQPDLLASFDSARILQVLINLISNALKFTQAHGKVEVRVSAVDGEVQVAVSDTGAGIPAAMLEAIFERFRQVDGGRTEGSERQGVGLGLYISRCIIQGHGGRIWCTSRVGEGSTFTFSLPSAL